MIHLILISVLISPKIPGYMDGWQCTQRIDAAEKSTKAGKTFFYKTQI